MKVITTPAKTTLLTVLLFGCFLVHGQKVNFSINEVIESFKRDNECHYCTKIYQFSTKVQQITNAIHVFESLSQKKQRKKLRRLQKYLLHFIDNASMEHKGLSKQITYTSNNDLEDSVRSLIKLKGFTERIAELLEGSSILANDIHIQSAKEKITTLDKAIGTSLTQLKKQ